MADFRMMLYVLIYKVRFQLNFSSFLDILGVFKVFYISCPFILFDVVVMDKKVTSLLSVQPHFRDGRYSKLKVKHA